MIGGVRIPLRRVVEIVEIAEADPCRGSGAANEQSISQEKEFGNNGPPKASSKKRHSFVMVERTADGARKITIIIVNYYVILSMGNHLFDPAGVRLHVARSHRENEELVSLDGDELRCGSPADRPMGRKPSAPPRLRRYVRPPTCT